MYEAVGLARICCLLDSAMAEQAEGDVGSWGVEQVARWLEAEGFPDYVPLLCDQHRLDGPSLLSLREDDLRTPPLQMTVLGDIKRLMLAMTRYHKLSSTKIE